MATEYVKYRVAGKIKKRASHLDVDEVDKTIERNEEPSMNSSITTESAKSKSEDLNRSQHSDAASHRVPPTVKFGPNWILREEHIQNIERTKGSGATDLTDQRLDVKLLGQERLSNEEATWQRKKTKFTADFKGYKELTYATYRHMLTEYMKHIHKGKQQAEIDVYMWNDLSDEFKSDFRNKYRNHCEAAKQVDVVYRKAIKHLDTYSKVPEDLEFETMLAQDMLVLMYISLLPIYTNGQQAQSFNAAITSMVGDEVAVFSRKYRIYLSDIKLLENYRLVVEGLTLCLSEIRKHLYIQEWYLNHTYPVQNRKDAGSTCYKQVVSRISII